ncbi:MAG: B12-binding domain-containing radical SAM protein [Deltaproteobacteria bacterium]|nr:B12-binding domain-containing radical SAM protein [Deltaproteobacteria bacterium]
MILFIEPVSKNIGMYVPAYPLPLLEIAGYVKKQRPGSDIKVISLPMDYGLPLNPAGKEKLYNDLLQDISMLKPLGIGISCTAISQAEETINLCERIKKSDPGIFTFIGGYFPTLYYEEIFKRTDAVDLIVKGEGEIPALNIIERLEEGKDPREMEVPGLIWKERGKLVCTRDTERFKLNEKAPLDLSLLRKPDAYDVLPYSFSRGCPYKCNFCMEDYIRPKRVAVPYEIVEQDLINLASACTAREIVVCDALFKSYDLVPLLRKLDMKIHFETRCDVFDPDIIPQIHDVCGTLVLGFESASFSTLTRMNKVKSRDHYERYLNNTISIFKKAAEYEIPLMMFMIAGYPGDTEADLIESYNFVEKLSSYSGRAGHIFKIGECHVYPKTKIHDLALSLPDVVFDDDGVFSQNIVRRPSCVLNFEKVIAYTERIYRLSNNTEKLQNAFLKMVPFFRFPASSLTDPVIPDHCYKDGERDILNANSDHLESLREVLSTLMRAKNNELSGERSGRVINL